MYLGVVLCVPGVQGDRLEVQTAIKIDRGHDVPLKDADEPQPSNTKVTQEDTYCKVGVMPLGPCVAAGVAAGVAGVTPFPLAACCPLAPGRWELSLLIGGVSSWEAPGNESEPGAVKALAWAALEGCVWMPSMIGVGIARRNVEVQIEARQI
jgi:hypothetical protein